MSTGAIFWSLLGVLIMVGTGMVRGLLDGVKFTRVLGDALGFALFVGLPVAVVLIVGALIWN